MSEKALWRYVKKGMGDRWHASRHDGAEPGTPDVSFGLRGVGGWIELKYMRKWPGGRDQIVHIRHFTDKQEQWLKRRGRHGGRCWFLLQVGREYLLFHWTALDALRGATRGGFYVLAAARWTGGIDWGELERALIADRPAR